MILWLKLSAKKGFCSLPSAQFETLLLLRWSFCTSVFISGLGCHSPKGWSDCPLWWQQEAAGPTLPTAEGSGQVTGSSRKEIFRSVRQCYHTCR